MTASSPTPVELLLTHLSDVSRLREARLLELERVRGLRVGGAR